MKNHRQTFFLLISILTIFESARGMDRQKQFDKKIKQLSKPPKKTILDIEREKALSAPVLNLDESSPENIAEYLKQSIRSIEALVKTLQNKTPIDSTRIAQLISIRSLKKSILTLTEQNITQRNPIEKVTPKELTKSQRDELAELQIKKLAKLQRVFIHHIINIAQLLDPKGKTQLKLDDNDRIAIIKLKDHPFLLSHQDNLRELSLQINNWNEFQQARELILSIVPEFPLFHPQKIVNDPIYKKQSEEFWEKISTSEKIPAQFVEEKRHNKDPIQEKISQKHQVIHEQKTKPLKPVIQENLNLWELFGRLQQTITQAITNFVKDLYGWISSWW